MKIIQHLDCCYLITIKTKETTSTNIFLNSINTKRLNFFLKVCRFIQNDFESVVEIFTFKTTIVTVECVVE